ncbi:hypothetical protein CHY08_27155 (plasmid) [Rhizobium leguminosarum bv. viciae]|nr:hypothetical protein CHY08_27155 [Rhizobium leguminosarum bv. viciae]
MPGILRLQVLERGRRVRSHGRRRASGDVRQSRREARREATNVGAEQTVDEEKADLVISTAHKSKGREWKSVRLMDDFLRSSPTDKENSGPDPAEMRLLYVALTRAKESLEAPSTIMDFVERGITPQRERVEVAPLRPHVVRAAPRQASPARPSSPPPSAAVPPVAPDVRQPPARKGLLGWLFGK